MSSTGLVTSVGRGSATITATSGTVSETASVIVEQVAASITLSASAVVLGGPGDTATVTATVRDTGGSEITSLSLEWSSEDEGIATVSSSGVVTAVASGSTTITVEVVSGGQTVTETLSITVSGRFLDPEFAVVVESDIVYATGAVRSPTVGEISLFLDIYGPADTNLPPVRPGFILIHGGGFTGGSKTNANMVALGSAYAARGYVSASINYRLVGDDPPTEGLARDPGDPVSVAAAAARVDAARAVEWMRANADRHRIDPNRIAIGGYSAGALTAMGVAYRDPGVDGADVQVVLSLSGGLYGDESIIEAGDPPLIMIHGTADGRVPFSLAEAIQTQALSVGLIHEFYPLAGVGHGSPSQLGTVVDGTTLADRIRNFFYIHLGLGAS